jgi:hypothetical protein
MELLLQLWVVCQWSGWLDTAVVVCHVIAYLSMMIEKYAVAWNLLLHLWVLHDKKKIMEPVAACEGHVLME